MFLVALRLWPQKEEQGLSKYWVCTGGTAEGSAVSERIATGTDPPLATHMFSGVKLGGEQDVLMRNPSVFKVRY